MTAPLRLRCLPRPLRVLTASACAALTASGLVACDPGTSGGLSAMAVSYTTDRAGTRALEEEGVPVHWLSCSARLNSATGASPSGRAAAGVDCEGETGDGARITITGTVTQEIGGRCVHGDLTAKSDGRRVFRAYVLGDCNAPLPTATRTPWSFPPAPGNGGAPRPTVTATVTVTVTETRTTAG
ncbi:hypothetical protein SSP531S_15240 [Streptomyces spongiicola]|uniref:Lipoprotein n=1 Tax=Streptomyces spongiicola TaxID=1690221 RepID=A0A388SVM0_9ACTN|nr:hypothetical protein [Streptomyces spongiicola]GBQ00114.1 hypothetical protein SSP531S_15240 [Streptomyces spongiicola]